MSHLELFASKLPVNSRSSLRPELPAPLLLRELRSAALDAELARAAGTWSTGGMEEELLDKFTPTKSKNTRYFRGLRNGDLLSARKVDSLQHRFPRFKIKLAFQHPLGQVLCDPTLPEARLREWLCNVGTRSVQRATCLKRTGTIHGLQLVNWKPWGNEFLSNMVDIGTVPSLFALVARSRLAQLEGNLNYVVEAEKALWTLLPKAISRSASLRLSAYALVLATDYFLSWQPAAEERLTRQVLSGAESVRASAISEINTIWASDAKIPEELKLARRKRISSNWLPDEQNPGTWWGMGSA